MIRIARPLLAAFALALAALGSACAVDGTEGALHVVTIERQVDGVLASYIDRAIAHAEDRGGLAVLLRIDTPGGEIGAMKSIVGRIERSEVPVIVWVGPPGAEAASAGTFIAMAGHVAAMAPSTTIGAATPDHAPPARTSRATSARRSPTTPSPSRAASPSCAGATRTGPRPPSATPAPPPRARRSNST